MTRAARFEKPPSAQARWATESGRRRVCTANAKQSFAHRLLDTMPGDVSTRPI